MTARALTITVVVALFLPVPCDGILFAQQTLPLPGRDSQSLIQVLESDRPKVEKAKACQQLAIAGDAAAVPALVALLSDDQLSTHARSALENIPGDSADQALRSACGSLEGNNLLGVILSLGKRQRSESIMTLAKYLDSEDQAVCIAAARAIGQIGTTEAVPWVERALTGATGERQLELGKAALICAQRLTEQGENKYARSLCQTIIKTDVPEKIKLSAAYQAILTQGEDGDAELLKMFTADDQGSFEMALYAARRRRGETSLSIELASMLKSLKPERQILTLALLADLGDQRVLPSILPLVTTGPLDLRVAVIHSISKLGDRTCIPVLLQAAGSSEQPLVEAAVEAAICMDVDQMDDAAIKMLNSDNTQSILSAIEIVAGRKIEKATKQLGQLRENSNEPIRKRAVYALGQVASADQLDQLVALMIEKNDDELFPDVQLALKSACLRMPQDDCARTLSAALETAPEKSKISLLEQLAFVGGPVALQTVVSAAISKDDAMQDAATRVLGEWLTADAAPNILELARSLPGGKYRTRVLRGYIRIARQLSMTMDERMEVCRNALALADRNEERLLVLDVLRRYRCREGLLIAESLANEKGLTGRAKSVIQRIKEDVGEDPEAGFVPLFDGRTLAGWKGGDLNFWRVEEGAIAGGDLVNKVKQNEFLRTIRQYSDFELRLQFKLTGDKTNAGVQFRTAEIPGDHEVSGYQADLGEGWWGCLYDESRRRKMLAGPSADEREKPVRMGQWNDYRILCEGKHIQIWLNEIKTVDYTEPDPGISQTGIIALQVHGNLTMEARYRNLRIKELR